MSRSGRFQIAGADAERYTTPIILLCEWKKCFTFIETNKKKGMKKLKLSGSVYGGMNGVGGLGVSNGRLVNSRPDSRSGIEVAAQNRKMMKREEKINMIAEGYSRGEMMSEMREMLNGID